MKKFIKILIIVLVFVMTSAIIGMLIPKESENNSNKNNSNNVDVEYKQITPNYDDNWEISGSNAFNMTKVSYMYEDNSFIENQHIKKIRLPIKTISDYTIENVVTVYLVNYAEVIANGTVYENEYKLVIESNTFNSNEVNEWVEFECDIKVGEGQSLAFFNSTDTCSIGYPKNYTTNLGLGFYFQVLSGTIASSNADIHIGLYIEE